MRMKDDVQYRLARVIEIMLEVARFSELECEEGKYMAIDIGVGGLALSRYMRDGVKDILTLESLYNSDHELLNFRNEQCQKQDDFIYKLFDEPDIELIEEVLTADEEKAIKEIYLKALQREDEEFERIAGEEQEK